MNKELEKGIKKIYDRQTKQMVKELLFLDIKTERKDISIFRKIWNIITFRKHKNYVVKQNLYKVKNIGKPIIKIGSDKE